MPEQTIETRVRYVFNNVPYLPGSALQVHTHRDDGWVDGSPDGAANYPWMMTNCIAWVETRVVYEPGEWGVVGEDEIEMVQMASGDEVPKACVDALTALDSIWPGATFPTARVAISLAVLNSAKSVGFNA